jgi:hypothetical protein
MIHGDMQAADCDSQPARLVEGDARECDGVPTAFANLVVTSPPYPNNYDYADATRLEMTFMREIDGWSNLQQAVRRHLVRSCTQHTTKKEVDLEETLAADELGPIRAEISAVCRVRVKVPGTFVVSRCSSTSQVLRTHLTS